MAYEITLDVFSGRENPKWIVPENELGTFSDKIEEAGHQRQNGRPSTVLGYRGMQISTVPSTPAQGREFLKVMGGLEGKLYVAGTPDLEAYLLSLAGSQVDDAIKAHVTASLAESKLGSASEVQFFPVCSAAEAPIFDLDIWNVPKVQPFNNCYNYANNCRTNSFAQPGRATSFPMNGGSCDGVQPSAQNDGLRSVDSFDDRLNAGDGYYVALVIWPGQDFHWYRQDKSGSWSHKPGKTAVTNKDNAGCYIADPRTCDRGSYTDFCCYMVTGSWVSIV